VVFSNRLPGYSGGIFQQPDWLLRWYFPTDCLATQVVFSNSLPAYSGGIFQLTVENSNAVPVRNGAGIKYKLTDVMVSF
jgi:hypothetical protein